MGLTQTVAPTAEPVSVIEAKAHLRVTDASDDDYIEGLIAAARQVAEVKQSRQLVTATWELTLDAFPNSASAIIYLPLPPLQSIASIQYVDTDGDTQTWASTKYDVDTNAEPGRVVPSFNESYPSTRGQFEAVTITFVAGYGNAGSVPEVTKSAIRILLAHLYENRESVITGVSISEIPFSAEALLMLNAIRTAH